ncbi:M56 family metallopeptidase [Gordonia zhaorongruii]|uniref:M56 family metallopeptidase n=1 Tax=Gordonia zhaorongruii TaxID=2597659 RepID=UPI0010499570|nr:M56 family metallopeptidase [Gordonia zhaorongruii]
MSPSILPVLLVVALLTTALSGPRMVRAAAPALTRSPRAAVAILAGGVAVWSIAFMAMGPLTAWMVTGKGGGDSAGICRRCLESSNPWAEPVFHTGIPTTVLMSGPALLVAVAVMAVMMRAVPGAIATRRSAARVRARAHTEIVRGHRVLVTSDVHPQAYALSRRHGGIVVSAGALDALEPEELDAVLAHEAAHLHQRHHLIAMLSNHIAHVLRPIPLIHAVASAIPLYLEVAADNAAREQTGTRALVTALLRLARDEPDEASTPTLSPGAALHAVGPHRIRTLVGCETSPRSHATVIATSVQSAVLVALSAAVVLPWLAAMTSGCA